MDRLYQTPSWDNPQGLTTKGGGQSWSGGIESHAPYQTGGGWPTVNGGVDDSCFIDNGMGNDVNLPSVFSPPHGVLPPPRPADKKCFAAVQSVCADHLTTYMDCYDCRYAPSRLCLGFAPLITRPRTHPNHPHEPTLLSHAASPLCFGLAPLLTFTVSCRAFTSLVDGSDCRASQ